MCGLADVALPQALAHTPHGGQCDGPQWPESAGQKHHVPGLTGKSPEELSGASRDIVGSFNPLPGAH